MLARRGEDVRYFGIAHQRPQAIGAEQEDIAGEQIQGKHIDIYQRLPAQIAFEDALPRRHRLAMYRHCLVPCQAGGDGVILRHPQQALALTIEVGAAVAHVGDRDGGTEHKSGGHGRAYFALRLRQFSIAAVDGQVGALHALFEQIGQIRFRVAQQSRHHDGGERGNRQATGLVSHAGVSHAVRDDKEANLLQARSGGVRAANLKKRVLVWRVLVVKAGMQPHANLKIGWLPIRLPRLYLREIVRLILFILLRARHKAQLPASQRWGSMRHGCSNRSNFPDCSAHTNRRIWLLSLYTCRSYRFRRLHVQQANQLCLLSNADLNGRRWLRRSRAI